MIGLKKKKSFYIYIWKRYCLFQEREKQKAGYMWRHLHVTLSLSLYYFLQQVLWIKSLQLLSSFFSDFFLILSETTGWYYQSCVSWEWIAGMHFRFSLLLVEHTDLRGKLSAPIHLQILTRLPYGENKVINLSSQTVYCSFTIFKSLFQ